MGLSRVLLPLAPVLALAACSNPSPASPNVPAPTPNPVRTVSWRLQLENRDQASFGLRISLDGERIYDHSGSPAVIHVVEIERPYVAGAHVIQFQVAGVRQSPSLYRAAVAVAGNFYDGVPTSLKAGDVLTLRVPL